MQVEEVKNGVNTVKLFSENTEKKQQLRDMAIGEDQAFFVPILNANSVVTMAGQLKYEAAGQLYTSRIDKSMAPVIYVKIWRTA